jgi:hypothetical protein
MLSSFIQISGEKRKDQLLLVHTTGRAHFKENQLHIFIYAFPINLIISI